MHIYDHDVEGSIYNMQQIAPFFHVVVSSLVEIYIQPL